jgi:hypothetical protein
MGILGGGVVTATAADAHDERGRGRAHLLDAAFTFAMRVASAGLVFVLQVFLARTMDLGDYGSYVTAWTWLVMLGAFMPLGFAESAVRFVPRYRTRARHGSAVAFWCFGLRVVLLVSLLMAGIAAIVALAGGLADSRTGLIVLLVAAGLPFLAVQNFLEGIARARLVQADLRADLCHPAPPDHGRLWRPGLGWLVAEPGQRRLRGGRSHGAHVAGPVCSARARHVAPANAGRR